MGAVLAALSAMINGLHWLGVVLALASAGCAAAVVRIPAPSDDQLLAGLTPLAGCALVITDSAGVVTYASVPPRARLRLRPSRLMGQSIASLLPRGMESRLGALLAEADSRPGVGLELRTQVRTDTKWVEAEIAVSGIEPGRIAFGIRDASQQSEMETELMRQAYSDPLTGLANRSLFQSRVEQAVREAHAPGRVAVLFIDLDGFKSINDSLGHDVGDQLLITVARRLQECVRSEDVVARLGGDEFAILIVGDDVKQMAVTVAERVSSSLPRNVPLAGRQISPGGSTGVAVADTGHETSEQLLRNADLAMYKSKALNNSSYVLYEEKMHEKVMARVQAESDLRQAIASGELVLHYQPVVNLATGRAVGVESLIRWAHSTKGLLSPASFIDLAEETGLVREIGEWALHTAAVDAAKFQRAFGGATPFHVSVNVSARQLDPQLIDTVRSAIQGAGLRPGVLMLEVTESVFADAPEEAADLLQRIRQDGIKIALDDFGTGYSSLSYLTRLPVDVLKVDKSFVRHLGGEQRTGPGELTRTILQMCRSLHLGAIAEGVETQQQREALLGLGCGFAQGFYFAAAMRADAIEELLINGGQLAASAAIAPASVTATGTETSTSLLGGQTATGPQVPSLHSGSPHNIPQQAAASHSGQKRTGRHSALPQG